MNPGEMHKLRSSTKNSDENEISLTNGDLNHQFVEELGFEDISYDDVLDKNISSFWKVNPHGFTGSKGNKRGFIIGPTFTPDNINIDENTIQYFEIFAPRVYIKEWQTSNLKTEYRLILAKYEKVTYVLLFKGDSYRMPENTYKSLSQNLYEKAICINRKIDPIVEYNDENPVPEEDPVKFFYYNGTNLAIKFTPGLTQHILSNEIKHFLNVIKCKFDDNSKLREYQVTTTNYWLIGKRWLKKILIVVISSSINQDVAEYEADRIWDTYFSHFIF